MRVAMYVRVSTTQQVQTQTIDKQIDRLPDLTAAGKAAGLVNDAHPAEMIMCPRRGKKKGRE